MGSESSSFEGTTTHTVVSSIIHDESIIHQFPDFLKLHLALFDPIPCLFNVTVLCHSGSSILPFMIVLPLLQPSLLQVHFPASLVTPKPAGL